MTEPDASMVAERLRLLVVFHYVVGGMSCVMGLIPVIHLTIGILALSGGLDGQGGPPPALFGWIFVIVGGVAILLAQTVGLLAILSARRIARRRSRTFSLVVAGILCLFFPFGTALGVFTLMLLTSEPYRRAYEPAVGA